MRHKVHSSMYAKLRTNLPREVMAYTDFAFDDLGGRSQDARRFPSHAEVRSSLCHFPSDQAPVQKGDNDTPYVTLRTNTGCVSSRV